MVEIGQCPPLFSTVLVGLLFERRFMLVVGPKYRTRPDAISKRTGEGINLPTTTEACTGSAFSAVWIWADVEPPAASAGVVCEGDSPSGAEYGGGLSLPLGDISIAEKLTAAARSAPRRTGDSALCSFTSRSKYCILSDRTSATTLAEVRLSKRELLVEYSKFYRKQNPQPFAPINFVELAFVAISETTGTLCCIGFNLALARSS